MNRTLLAASLIALFSTLSAPALAKDAAKPFATVNGKAIPQARADALMAGQKAQGQPDSEQLRKAVYEELVRREALAQESVRKGMDKKPEVQAQMEMARQGVLIGAYLQDYVKTHPVSDEAIKKEYEGIRVALGDKEYKARHVLVEKEDEARAIIEKLAKGEKFEELAKQSKDPGSKERGGDLGWANKSAYVPQFSEAMVKLAKGKHTEAPVKSDFGWHVILLEDTRELKAPPMDGVKPQIAQRIQQQMVEKHILELRGKAKVE
ncbi:MAG: peptidylprolyl isomerase [Rhodocyclaceae bacterium]|nr:peptidylprolyl isomerase [Rhodocyclaceae bacterium]